MIDSKSISQMLNAYDVPAILVTADYQVLASNKLYSDQFGKLDLEKKPRCYAVSHGYTKPCDQAGEDCPLLAATSSKRKEKVLHIHQTPNGREHVDVEMIPIFNDDGDLSYFVELLKPVPLASGKTANQQMIGSSPAFEKMLTAVTLVANSNASVLLLGESGTGKELISQTLHLASSRSNKPLVTLECAGLSETLIESELFGHKKGAFTGANTEKIGLVEQADGGTLFLDEIGDVSLQTQVKLLRLIESKTFRRVGSTEVRHADFRLICATHRNLPEMIKQELFRQDLYYRINVFPINIPPLRERISDITALSQHFLRQENTDMQITESALIRLKQYDFKGNIRELKNLMQRAMIINQTNVISADTVDACIAIDKQSSASRGHSEQHIAEPALTLKDLEKNYLIGLMNKHNQDKAKVAKEAELSLRTLYRKLEQM